MTFATDIEEAAEGEPIEAIVIGEMGWEGYGDDDRHAPGLARKGEILRWAEARPLLDYEYDRGFGAPDCQAIRAWTENKVIWVTQYDGSTSVNSALRNPPPPSPDDPTSFIPMMPGG